MHVIRPMTLCGRRNIIDEAMLLGGKVKAWKWEATICLNE